jgi:hypothetical protein
MRVLPLTLLILTLVLLSAAPTAATGQTIIERIDPIAPTAGAPIVVWLRTTYPVVFSGDTEIEVGGGVIRLRSDVDIVFQVPGPPGPEFDRRSIALPPLAVGNYTIELYSKFVGSQASPQVVDSFGFGVAGAQPEVIPSTDMIALLLLALVVLASSRFVRR